MLLFPNLFQNSLDIPPNSLAQVALAISHRRTNSRASRRSIDIDGTTKATIPFAGGEGAAAGIESEYRYTPGSAYTAARRKSLDEIGKGTLTSEQMDDLTRTLESSPRKTLGRGSDVLRRRNSNRKGQELKEGSALPSYQKIVSDEAPRLSAPRLMSTTSGLGFDSLYDSTSDADADGENSNPNNTPKRSRHYIRTDSGPHRVGSKVSSRRQKSLPELEQGKLTRELKLARKRSRTLGEAGGWRNVAVEEVQRKEREGELDLVRGFAVRRGAWL